tara:strand:- start:1565 stop:1720 length:156 start_codon:yes stop_codon:yes gene_type:complete
MLEEGPTSAEKHHKNFGASGPPLCEEQRGKSPLQLLSIVNNFVSVAAERCR